MIQTVTQRAKLAARREPYFIALGKGRHVGFRKLDDAGTWIARAYDEATKKRTYRALGDFASLPPAEHYQAAVKAATAFFEHTEQGGISDNLTVAQACERYLSMLGNRTNAKRNERNRRSLLARLLGSKRRAPHPLGRIVLSKLRGFHLAEWIRELEGADSAGKRRSPATVDREKTALRAALNLAVNEGREGKAAEWNKVLAPTDETGETNEYASPQSERDRLLKACPTYGKPFVRASCLLPIRPGALAALRVRDFNAAKATLYIPVDKAHAGRTIPLSPAAVALLSECARNKLPGASLFTRWDGVSAWNANKWGEMIAEAARLAKLPKETCAYSIRHGVISDLISSGMDTFSIAKVAGTSLRMIEKTYGHLKPSNVGAALQALAG